MAENVDGTLCSTLRRTKFALQRDESTLPGNESLLLSDLCFIKDKNLIQELLFERPLRTDTNEEAVFCVVEKFFKDKKLSTHVHQWFSNS